MKPKRSYGHDKLFASQNPRGHDQEENDQSENESRQSRFKLRAYNRRHLEGRNMAGHKQAKKPDQTTVPSPELQHSIAASLYRELHKLAVRKMRLERGNHTLQPTALVNEAYLRIADESVLARNDRTHVLAAAAQVMRHILVDHARARRAGKRGGIQNQVTLDENILQASSEPVDILLVHEALERLTALDPRQGRIVELHFFAGLSFEEIASVLGVSERTVKRDWAMARLWLFKEISG